MYLPASSYSSTHKWGLSHLSPVFSMSTCKTLVSVCLRSLVSKNLSFRSPVSSMCVTIWIPYEAQPLCVGAFQFAGGAVIVLAVAIVQIIGLINFYFLRLCIAVLNNYRTFVDFTQCSFFLMA